MTKIYDRDETDSVRRAWEKLSLTHLPYLTVHDLRTFKAQFEYHMVKIGNISEQEAVTKFVNALPQKHNEEIVTEMAKRNRKQGWVQIMKPCGLTHDEIRTWVVQLGGNLPQIKDNSTEILVKCGEEEIVEGILSLDGEEVNGMPLQIKEYRKKMNVDEIFQWLVDKLQIVEDLDSNYASQNTALWEVKQEKKDAEQKSSNSSHTSVDKNTPLPGRTLVGGQDPMRRVARDIREETTEILGVAPRREPPHKKTNQPRMTTILMLTDIVFHVGTRVGTREYTKVIPLHIVGTS